MRALLVSTYDLGRQPFGVASPAAWLRRAGIEVDCADTSRETLGEDRMAAAAMVAFYLPMHTATRLAVPLIGRVRRVNPHSRICAYGLYAPLNAEWLQDCGVDDVLGPEAEQDLLDIACRLEGSAPSTARRVPAERGDPRPPGNSLPRPPLIQPDRAGLPPLDRYASLCMPDGQRLVVGTTDATRGCKHLCRHCPIVPVYGGRFRAVPIDVVIADVRAQVARGAQHVSFGDPDFFNGPTHARRVVERISRECPGLTYDVTIKIEHLLSHADLLPLLRETGCLFVTSAVESIDDEVLGRLRKGHSRSDFIRVVGLCRDAGVTLAPTFIPFTPWATLHGYVELLELLDALELVEHVASIQLAIRLLVTARSPLLELPEIENCVAPFDRESLTWPWRHADPQVDALHGEVMRLIAGGGDQARCELFDAIAAVARARAGLPARPARSARGVPVPYVSEPWYCCAEPIQQF